MNDQRPIVFFDGVCNLCNFAVNRLMKADKKHIFYVASLQGKTAEKILNPEDRQSLHSVVLWDRGQVYYKSSALFQVAWRLGGVFWLIMPFWLIPRIFTNWIYDIVALSRYRVFGKKDICRIPTESEQKHFLD